MEGEAIRRFSAKMPKRKHRMNAEIRVDKIRVIDDEGEQLGLMAPREALELARQKGLDLIEVAPNAKPPVAKILDYGKFKYQEKKKEALARKKQTHIALKEMKFRPKTDIHDITFKVKHVLRFLEEGNRVKLTVFFRGREMAFTKKGFELLDKVMGLLGEAAKVDTSARLEGNRLMMTVSPVGLVNPKESTENQGARDAKAKN